MQTIGRRERNKQDKQERIKAAAWRLFRQQGFEATTTRQIAEEADVATGTLFLYAKDKNHLLILLFEERLGEISTQAAIKARDTAFFIPALLETFTPLFEFYAQDSALSRQFVKEYLAAGSSAPRDAAEGFVGHLVGLVVQGQAREEISKSVNPVQAALNCFALYYAALTAFLTSELEPTKAVQQFLQPALELQFRGLKPEEI